MRFKKAIPIVVSIMTASILAPIMVSCNNVEQVTHEAIIKIVSEHGKVKLSVDGKEFSNETPKIEVGKKVQINVTTDDGYVVKNISLDKTVISQSSIATFTIEKSGELLLEVEYEQIQNTTKVVIENSQNGSISILNQGLDLERVPYGTIVKLSVNPNEGYELASLTVNEHDIKTTLQFECQIGIPLFTVKADFVKKETTPEPVKKATITIEETEGGSVKVSNSNIDINDVKIDTRVYLEVQPSSGYTLKDLSVNGKSIINTQYFVVREYINYVVKATFTKNSETNLTNATITPVNISGNTGAQLSVTPANFETTNVKITDVQQQYCYVESGKIRVSSGKNSGSLTFTLDKEYPISQIKILGNKYNADNPKVSINCGTETVSKDFLGDTIFDFPVETKSSGFSISSASKNRFIIDSIVLVIGEGGGTVNPSPNPNPNPNPDPTPNPEKQEAAIFINKVGDGDVVLDKDKGFAGDIVKATITPKETTYLSTIEFNGEFCWLDANKNYVSLTLKPGNNTLNVTFKEKATGETGKFDHLYGNSKIKPTRGNLGSYDSYYEPIRGLKGPALKAGLNKIIKGHKTFSYKSLNSSMLVTDIDPFNSSNIIFTYEGSLRKGTAFNKEHTWAKSVGDFGTSTGPGTDMHHLRPSDQNLNSTRSNFDFAEVTGGKDCGTSFSWSRTTMKGNYVGGGKFEPKDEFKGDVARMIFYMATRYEGGDGYVDLEVGSSKGNISGIDSNKYYTFGTAPGLHGSFNDLYKWATTPIDPVSDFEVNRNNIIDEKYQHNRNPFIDHPEFIQMIYDKNYDGPGALNDK